MTKHLKKEIYKLAQDGKKKVELGTLLEEITK